jgi:hypothetical protein
MVSSVLDQLLDIAQMATSTRYSYIEIRKEILECVFDLNEIGADILDLIERSQSETS